MMDVFGQKNGVKNKKSLLTNYFSLSPELQQVILSFLGGVVDAINYFKIYGPFSRMQYLCWGFPAQQNPSVLGVFGIFGKPWWDHARDCAVGNYALSKVDKHYTLPMSIREICNTLESNVHVISKEFRQLRNDASAYRERLKANPGSRGEWNAFYLMDEGIWNTASISTCPVTSSLLRQLPICESSFGYVYFSVLSPHTSIDTHCGATNTKLRIQLPLINSSRSFSNCFLTVNGEERKYHPGRAVVFDDSFAHSVRNSGDDERVVLLIDIWHPSLSPSSIAEISAVFNANFLSNNDILLDGGHVVKFPVSAVRDPKRPYDCILKCCLIGDCGAGKTSFLLRWAENQFSGASISTIGIDFKIRSCRVRNCIAKVQLWDTAGPERFRTITSAYFRGAQVILVVGDVTAPVSSFFRSIDTQLGQIRSFTPPSTTVIVIGTKTDLVDSRRVSYEEARAFVSERGYRYFEVSSKTGGGVDSIMFYAVKTHLIHRVLSGSLSLATPAAAAPAATSSPRPSKSSRCVLH